MTPPSSETQETLIGTNGITHISSDNAGDTMDIDFYEGRYNGRIKSHSKRTNKHTINGQSAVALPTALCRATKRLQLGSGNHILPRNGTLSSGVPLTPQRYMIIPGRRDADKKHPRLYRSGIIGSSPERQRAFSKNSLMGASSH